MADPDPSKWRYKPKHPLPQPPPIVPPSPPVPNPHGINPDYQNIDISDELFDSDGDETTWPTTSKKSRVCDKKFLARLTKAYNGRPDLVKQWSGQPIVFEGEPPRGYALFKASDMTIHGHPSGKPFRSIVSFMDHLHAILLGSAAKCRCAMCIEEGRK